MSHMVKERNISLRGLVEVSCQLRIKMSKIVNIAVKGATMQAVSLYVEAIQIRILRCPLIMLKACIYIAFPFP